jgi:hypothetical protein
MPAAIRPGGAVSRRWRIDQRRQDSAGSLRAGRISRVESGGEMVLASLWAKGYSGRFLARLEVPLQALFASVRV